MRRLQRKRSRIRWSAAALLGGGLASSLFWIVPAERKPLKSSPLTDIAYVASGSTSIVAQISAKKTPREPTWHEQAAEAVAEQDPAKRELLVATLLRLWAASAPEDAAAWALQRPLIERSADLGAVLAGAAQINPAVAIALAQKLVYVDPALAHDHGCSLVLALAEQNDFVEAAAFAARATSEHRDAWLNTAFSVWAEHQPQAAAEATALLPDSTDRDNLFHTVVGRWANLAPRGLADFALMQGTGSHRRFALDSALSAWSQQDAAGASAWIDRLPPSAELDAGVAAIATQPLLITYSPENAVDWAESLFDPQLREHTLLVVISEWAKRDRLAAQRFAENSQTIAAADRSALLDELNSPSSP